MRITLLCVLYISQLCSGLIRLDWETLSNEVTIRYFHPDFYFESSHPQEIWDSMGENISCSVSPDMTVNIDLPSGFDASKPIKLLTHGFMDTMVNDNTQFVSAWMDHLEKNYAVILLDWHNLAYFAQISDWDDFVYDLTARNSIDVGEFAGLCLGKLFSEQNMLGESLHLLGHSLGAHLVGKAGRSFKASHENQDIVGRITGLDPAGPRFFDGPILSAIPELHSEILCPESAAFVDIIHSNGGLEPVAVSPVPRLGALQQLGHLDFYPDGGSVQQGCMFGIDALPGGACSHVRSLLYYLHSIRENALFPSSPCSTVELCNQEQVEDNSVIVFMGEMARQTYQGNNKLVYTNVEDCHWTYEEHNYFLCAK